MIALLGAIFFFYDWHIAVNYIVRKFNFVEAEFVVVIMTLASTRSILKLTESIMQKFAYLLGGSLTAWWFTLPTAGPILGSLITEPAAMTISALLLAHKFYDLEPSAKLKYATIGLLFVNEELGFAQAVDQRLKELIDNIKTRLADRLRDRHLSSIFKEGLDQALVKEAFEQRFEEIRLREMRKSLPGLLPENERPPFKDPEWDNRDDPVPAWVTLVHVFFMVWTIVNAHYPELFIPGLLFFLGFSQVTAPFQNRIDLKPALLVGFFLGGLVIHGGVQGWWIAPVLGNLAEIPLMLGAAILTAFNDNNAITFLSTLVPNFTDALKYALVAGAVAGGGLTVIANAPNPAGLSILKKYFSNEVSPAGILKFALLPTIVMLCLFIVFR